MSNKKLMIAASLLAYIGTKTLSAAPMTRGNYNELRGWQIPPDEKASDEGYLVMYPLTGNDKPNVEGFDGYVSWSPKSAFEESYRQTDNMNFGLALEALKKGLKVARQGWNGKGMWLQYNKGGDYEFSEQNPFIVLKNVRNSFDVWHPSTPDCLADDWVIVE